MSTTDTLAAMRDEKLETARKLEGGTMLDDEIRERCLAEVKAIQEAIDALALADRYKAEPMLYRCRWYSGPNVVKVIAYDEQAVKGWLDGRGYIDLVESLTGNRITYLPPGWNREDADKAFEALEAKDEK